MGTSVRRGNEHAACGDCNQFQRTHRIYFRWRKRVVGQGLVHCCLFCESWIDFEKSKQVELVDRGDGHKWANVDETHLAQLMKSVCEPQNRERMLEIGRNARKSMVERYSVEILAKQIRDRLMIIREKLDSVE
jgi:hypothetical protein